MSAQDHQFSEAYCLARAAEAEKFLAAAKRFCDDHTICTFMRARDAWLEEAVKATEN